MAAEEPQPDNVREGGVDAAKASAALSSLDRNDDDGETANKGADTEALGKAMANLDVKEVMKEKEAPKKVKLDTEDVKLLVRVWTVTDGVRGDVLICRIGAGAGG
jgi:hypothetical protein